MSKKAIARKGNIYQTKAVFESAPHMKQTVFVNDLTGRQHVREVRKNHVTIN